MSARYYAYLTTPDGKIVEEKDCDDLTALAHALLEYGERDDQLDELGEASVLVYGAGYRRLSDTEHEALTAILEEWGGFVPRNDDEVAHVRFKNPRRQP